MRMTSLNLVYIIDIYYFHFFLFNHIIHIIIIFILSYTIAKYING